MTRFLVQKSIENFASAGSFTATEGFPEESLLNSVIRTVCEHIGSKEEENYCLTAPILFLPSHGSFFQEYRIEDKVFQKSYRCFWYLSPKTSGVLSEYPELTAPERDAAFADSGVTA